MKKTVVFDLDETLIFAQLDPSEDDDFVLELAGQTIYVRTRPGVPELVAAVRDQFKCRVWSTGQQIYVDAICKEIGIDDFEAWGRERCRRLSDDERPEGHLEPFDKPLNYIGVPPSDIVIVDNSPGVFACNPDNGIRVESWHGDRQDRQLIQLIDYLHWLKEQDDMRRDHNGWTLETLLMRNAQGVKASPSA